MNPPTFSPLHQPPSGCRALAWAALVLAVTAACMTSRRPEELRVANDPRGAWGELYLADRSRTSVELLEVRDSGLVVLRNGRVTLVDYDDIEGARFDHVGDVLTYRGHVPTGKRRDRMRFVSRYPFGIPEPAMRDLLQAAGQEEPDVIRPEPRS